MGTVSRSKRVRIQVFPCKRKAYPYQFGYGSVWIHTRVNGVLANKLSLIKAFSSRHSEMRNVVSLIFVARIGSRRYEQGANLAGGF